MANPILKPIRLRSKKILDSARGEDCQIRMPGVCNNNPETTVACHLNGGGMGTKHSDIFIAYGCSDCHAFVDSETQGHVEIEDAYNFFQAIFSTQQILIDKGLICTK